MDMPGPKPVIAVGPSLSKETTENDDSKELNCLASYLLQMKTGFLRSSPANNTRSRKSFLLDDAQRVHRDRKMETDKQNKSHQTILSQSLSNSAAKNSSLKEEHGSLPMSNETLVIIKPRNSKVHLSHCAGGENFVVVSKKLNKDACHVGSYLDTSKNVVAQSNEQPAPTNFSAVRSTSLLEPSKQLPIKVNSISLQIITLYLSQKSYMFNKQLLLVINICCVVSIIHRQIYYCSYLILLFATVMVFAI